MTVEAVSTSETLVIFQQSTRRNISEDGRLHTRASCSRRAKREEADCNVSFLLLYLQRLKTSQSLTGAYFSTHE